ncbi:carboxyl transferase domain-containing protein [Gordonia terrae]|uniref:Acetyl-coenzyme A carboxylase carboxyl transferase subunits beta/alpha n=2 Tax=Gordonia terrae TaxID=2055 RepID=A0AAD0K7S9_9ACTN|nr:carboxyl transferase domain-containing protein [Gordonia terrae]VTR06951.1 acetyl-CoA carboxylase carboxyl transferase subunit beta/alpha [Clostridioides difficile]ANY22630.1 carboxyl transferase [Gordonia terrae]AWO83368.1 carboxyl transferase [Gordonia terrae]VTS38738.1 Acetyl-coenzyme A carboxylase carboxyl transferase subunit beta [Gordonia terrae]GAB43268.1 acetyl-CoA carboxylase beta chain [Gordonia terrae NBRC 100016]
MGERARLSAPVLRDMLVDEGTWESWDSPVESPASASDGDDDAYAEELARSRERTGSDESVITGSGVIGGHPVVMVISEFGFLGGSIGRAAGARIVTAVRRATHERLPLLALPASGGTRMQEGTAAFLQMVAITGSVTDHKAAGLPYLVYLRHPTTGGVFASWGSLGHITWAQPGALIGFLGPRVYEGLHGEPFPDDVQTAENLVRTTVVDDVVAPLDLRDRLSAVLRLLARRGDAVAPTDSIRVRARRTRSGEPDDTWACVRATREPERAGLVEFLAHGDSAPLSDAGPLRFSLSDFDGHVALVVGYDRTSQAAGELPGPRHLREARRALLTAGDLGLPVVTVIDTPGAELSVVAEEGGLAAQIARCTVQLISAPVPTVSVLLGQGAGGAALALFPADFRVARADAWLSPLPPEGASLIVHRDLDHAGEMASRQGILAGRMAAQGMIDVVVDAGSDDEAMSALRDSIARYLAASLVPDSEARTRVPTADAR